MTPKRTEWELMDKITLEREYSPSSCVPDYEELVARYTSESLVAEDTVHFKKDLMYDLDSKECLDLCTTNNPNSPLLIFIHGGYWQFLGKNDSLFPAKSLTDSGIAYCAIDYTLAPKASISEMLEQCRRSIQWLYKNALKYGYNADQIFLAGSSAGAHLAAMTILTDWSKYDLPENVIKGGTLLSGVFDLQPLVKTYINEPLKLDSEEAKRISPLFEIKQNDTELIVCWGENETSEFKRQSIEFEKKWKDMGNRSSLLEVQHANHFDIVFFMLDKNCSLSDLMMKQILGEER
ncbi:MAG: arylformamidase [Woeseiaceae bacterium]|jgi:arylformamidase|tara:strand:+ start:16738 stop:17613 length:876 start_codon:yes stop_codon:yes gene_type:complete